MQEWNTNPAGETTATAAAWFLVGQLGKGDDDVHVGICSSPFSIGRRGDASLSLPFQTVSSNHAELELRDEDLVLRDLNSTNGTYVNGKPVNSEIILQENDLVQFANVALRVRKQEQQATNHTVQEDVYDQVLALVQVEKLMNESCVVPYYQPVVELPSRKTIGYEVLGRSRLFGIETPAAMFRAASQLNLEVQLSVMLRWEGIRQSSAFATHPHLYVNTHPSELSSPGLVESLRSVREANPTQPITLEIHEAAVSDLDGMRALKSALRDLDILLAYDDFGAGQARMVELIEVRPDVLKFDVRLIRGIDEPNSHRQRTMASLVTMVRDLGVIALAEGVETESEHEACQQIGFQMGQGFYYGRPAPASCF